VIIGSIERNEAYAKGIMNFRVIDAFIKNTDGKLFVPRRHPNKRLFPLSLDVSVGGHVTSGDTYDETFRKEAMEELNLNIDSVKYRKLGTMTPRHDGVSNFITVYEIETNTTPRYNTDDFVEHFWLTPQEIFERLKNGDSAKGNMPIIIRKFFL
jgi:isopentenyldiphosphate isomerase